MSANWSQEQADLYLRIMLFAEQANFMPTDVPPLAEDTWQTLKHNFAYVAACMRDSEFVLLDGETLAIVANDKPVRLN